MGKTVAAVVAVVAVVAIAVAAPYLAPLALGVLGITATATAIAVATAVITIGLSLAVSLAFTALGVGAPSAKNQVGPPQVFRQSIANSFICYGRRRLGGLLVFFHSRQDSNGAHWRYFVIACAGHQCHGVVSYMLNDEVVSVPDSSTGLVTSGKYANNAWLWFARGTYDDGSNSDFVDTAQTAGLWTSAHKGRYVAKLFARFRLTDDIVAAGMPNMTVVIDGKDNVVDTRDGVAKFTANGALVFYDWMEMPREEGGFGAYSDEIPADAWVSAQANVCDETVSGEARYALDAVITTGATPSEIRDSMIVNMAGTYAYSGGKHLMRPGYWVPTSATLSEDDLSGPIQVSPFMPPDVAANEINGTYVSPANGYQGMALPTQSLGSGDIKQMDLDLAFVTSSFRGQRIAQIMLKRAAAEKTVVWPMNIMGLKQAALDTVQLASTRYGLDNYAWQVANWGLSADFGVVLSLREENSDIYADPTPASVPSPGTIGDGSTVRTLDEIMTILRGTYPKTMTVDAIDAGTTASIRLYGPSGTSSNFILDYPGTLADATVTPKTITGKSFSITYYPYVDVDPATLQPATFGATNVYGDALNSTAHPYRVFLNRAVLTPADGATPTTGGGTGGTYGGGFDPGDGSGLKSYP